ncbi:hypothetical protein JHK84_050563 [Glycine max]|nr:hypothetical protein JHK86_050508 [Glycine max]KAG5094975.1 hypothetical protein JHK84_050563 [Glycine max]
MASRLEQQQQQQQPINARFKLVELVGLLVIVWSWDEQFLVESYMAYYIVVHNLQNGGMYGSNEAVSSKKYLQDSIFSIRKLANKRGGPPVASQTGVTYVNGWKVEGLSILQNKFSRDTPILLQTQILEALQQSFVVQSSSPFLNVLSPRSYLGKKKHVKFSKNISAAIVATTTTEEIPEYKLPSWAKFEIGKVAVYWKPMNGLPPTSIRRKAVDLILPFGEIEVLKENWDLIKRQIGLENVEILSAANGLIVSSHKESLKHFKKPWAHVHELVKEVVNVVKIKSTTSGLDYFFIKANFGILDDVGALWNPSTIDHVIPD